MRKLLILAGLLPAFATHPAAALSLAPEEFSASRQMACVLAEQSLGHLTEEEYGALTHDVLDGFEGEEQDNILSKALGYVDGLMFDVASQDQVQVNARLLEFVDSPACASEGYSKVTLSL